jgi:signal transduction histidine kinase
MIYAIIQGVAGKPFKYFKYFSGGDTMTAMLNKKAAALVRKNSPTDPKSCDYLSWFYCSGERNQSQMAFLLRQDYGPGILDLRSVSGAMKRLPPLLRRSETGYAPFTPNRGSGPDVVEIIKQAKSRGWRKVVRFDRRFTMNRGVRSIDPDALSTFIGGAAHHFNNLFMVIQGNISLMALEMDEAPNVADEVKRIENLIQCESILVNDLMGGAFTGQARPDSNCQVTLLENIFSIDAALHGGIRKATAPVGDLFQEFVGGVTRIMNRLLDEILRLTQALINRTPVRTPYHHRFQTILSQLDKGFRLVENLDEYLGVDHEDHHAVNAKILTETLIHACFQPQSRVRFHLSLDRHLAPIQADPHLIAKIIQRLVQNSSEALSEGGDIYLDARNLVPRAVVGPAGLVRSARVVIISLKDTGPGVDPAAMHRIFDPFFTTRRDSSSTGLGLASVRGILKSIGGSIRYCPQRGPGAVFEIYLPAADLELIRQ